MRNSGGLGRISRKLPDGFIRLLLLAVLLGLMVLGWVTQAAEHEPERTGQVVWNDDMEIIDSSHDFDQTLVIGNDAHVNIHSGGLVYAGGTVVLEGMGSIAAVESDAILMIGSTTPAPDTPKANGMYAKQLDRNSHDATLTFGHVIVNQGTGDFNLGAIKRTSEDSFHEGGIYIGGDWDTRKVALDALNARTLETTDNTLLNTDVTKATSKIRVNGNVVLSKGGEITLAGHKYGNGGITGKTLDMTTGKEGDLQHIFNMTGGVLDMTSTYGAEVRMKDVIISDGIVNLGAEKLYLDDDGETNWTNAPAIIGAGGKKGNVGSFKIQGGTINLGDYGTLRTDWTDAGHAGSMSITGGVITMSGGADSQSVIRAAADAGRYSGQSTESTLHIGNKAEINVVKDGHGVILSRDTTFSGGNINVDGMLVVAGAADENTATVMEGITSENTNKWGNFRFNNGTMTLGSKNGAKGVVDFVTGGMTLTAASGTIDGKLWIVDSDTSVDVDSASGVYSTNLTVTKSDNRFTVSDLAVNSTSNNAGDGVTINGKMVVKDTISASSDVAEGALSIAGGSLTADDKYFVTYETENGSNDIVSFTVDSALATALQGSNGTLNLNASSSSTAYNMTSEQYAQLKKELGLTGGLNLLGVIVSDRLEWTADGGGNIDMDINNPSAQVDVDASEVIGSDLIFNETLSVKELIIKGGEIETVTLNKSGTFTGSGNPDIAIIKGGVYDAMDLRVKGFLNLGIAGNKEKQGGLLGNITFIGLHDGKAGMEVVDGEFKVGKVTIAETGVDANFELNVSCSGSSGQNTFLQTHGIDFSKHDNQYSSSVNVADASLIVADGITLNGNSDSGLRLDDGAYVSTKYVKGANVVSVEDGSRLVVKEDITMAAGKPSLVKVAGGSLTAEKLDLGAGGGQILVGDQNRKGSLVVGEAALRGGTLFADPTWKDGPASVANASSIMIGKFANDTSDGNIIIGQNSHFTYGSHDADWLTSQINNVGVWGSTGSHKVAAALGLYKPMTIGDGYSLTVNGGITGVESSLSDGSTVVKPSLGGYEYSAGRNTANFGSDSLLVVNAGALKGNTAALTAESGTGTLNVEDGAKLYIYNAQSGNEIKLVDGFTTVSDSVGTTAWTSSNNLNDSEMTHVVIRPNGSAVLATVTARDAKTVYQSSSKALAEMLNEVYGYGDDTKPVNDVDSKNAGISFISKASSKGFNGSNLDKQVATMEGGAQIAAVGGAPLHAFNVMRLTSDAIRKRYSFAAGLIPHPNGHGPSAAPREIDSEMGFGSFANNYGNTGKKLMAVWAAPVYQHSSVSGTKVGEIENKFSTNLYGANLGLDFDVGENLRFGLVGDLGGGKAKTKSGSYFAKTENSIDYLGISGYGAWSTCNLSILVDGGYQRLKNDIKQDNWLDGGYNKADPKVHGWTFGVTAEYLAHTDFADIVPHMSLRYEGVNTDEHAVRSKTGTLFDVESDTQHVLSVPVGITVSKDFTPSNGVRVTPYADLGATFAMGNRHYKPTVNIPGMKKHQFTSRVLDPATFNGSVGVNADSGRVFGGVNYSVNASSKQTSHNLWANVGVSF